MSARRPWRTPLVEQVYACMDHYGLDKVVDGFDHAVDVIAAANDLSHKACEALREAVAESELFDLEIVAEFKEVESMDPKACLRDADQAISDGEYVTARDHLNDYAKWRAGYGYEPIEVAGTLMRGDQFAAWCHQRVADALR